MAPISLAALFIAETDGRFPSWAPELSRLEAVLAEGLIQTHAALPGVEIDRGAFVAAVASATADADAAPERPALEELALALGYTRGDPMAQKLFEQRYFRAVRTAVARFPLPSDAVREVEQTIRERLFVARDDGQARILRYAGRGALAALVRAAAVRVSLDLVRARRRRDARHQVAHAATPPLLGDPELSCIRADRRAALKAAFATAVTNLRPRERGALRMQTLGGLTIDQLARTYDVHRSSVVRWLAAARAAIASHTRHELVARFKISATEVDAMLETITSADELSLSRVFGPVPEPARHNTRP